MFDWTLLWWDRLISIPTGSIKIKAAGLSPQLVTGFQFQLVRLKCYSRARPGLLCLAISIPTGSIKIINSWWYLTRNQVISIPTGSIKIVDGTERDCRPCIFQFQLVRLKYFSNQLKVERRNWISIPTGSIKINSLNLSKSRSNKISIPTGSIKIIYFFQSLLKESVISIPTGSIKIVQPHHALRHVRQFQFQLVRLKLKCKVKKWYLHIISIPTGSIKMERTTRTNVSATYFNSNWFD